MKGLIPIRIRQFPVFAREYFRKKKYLKQATQADQVLKLCYFSCYSYFQYLFCSVHSLKRIQNGYQLKIVVFCDRLEMFSESQQAALRSLFPDIEIVPWGKSQGWGIEQIESIWAAYDYAQKGLKEGDYVARIDSDVFFFSDWLFSALARVQFDLVGDGHFIDFKYVQGGVYFVRVAMLRKIIKDFASLSLRLFLEKNNIGVEDQAVSRLVEANKGSVWLTYFMMFPDEYRIAGKLSPYQKEKFCCYHQATKSKAPMLPLYRKELLLAHDIELFNRNSATL